MVEQTHEWSQAPRTDGTKCSESRRAKVCACLSCGIAACLLGLLPATNHGISSVVGGSKDSENGA